MAGRTEKDKPLDKPLVIRISSSKQSAPGGLKFDLTVNIPFEKIANWTSERRRAFCDGIALILEARDDSGKLRRLKSELSERLSLLISGDSRMEVIDVPKTRIRKKRRDNTLQTGAGALERTLEEIEQAGKESAP